MKGQTGGASDGKPNQRCHTFQLARKSLKNMQKILWIYAPKRTEYRSCIRKDITRRRPGSRNIGYRSRDNLLRCRLSASLNKKWLPKVAGSEKSSSSGSI